jgi:hypothetical protein
MCAPAEDARWYPGELPDINSPSCLLTERFYARLATFERQGWAIRYSHCGFDLSAHHSHTASPVCSIAADPAEFGDFASVPDPAVGYDGVLFGIGETPHSAVQRGDREMCAEACK